MIPRPEYPVIDELVQNPAVSPAEAVQNLLRAREVLQLGRQESESASDIDGNHTWYAMTEVVDTANITPAELQDKLIDFIFELHRTEVPYLSLYSTDCYHFNFKPEYARQIDEDPQKEYPPSDLQEWENRNAFMAHLTRRVEHLCHHLDASLYAFYSCRSVEEAVRTACIWYIYAGQRVWENCQVGRLFGDEDQTPRRDMHMDRWCLWKDRLKTAQREFPRESTQEMIRKALEEVEKAEHGK
ncbi:hypothetical protein BO83DRAFT_404364 [Aspergillus eucalypticola CBS 122712]|uniref:Uncharacterized protein n=1 Tax=Aspergillus eucalypticola (strain CBS 122712 / IBT 29274) TaxID=1448314 RepID=A0A317UMI3_ASPEC|nr:uncharacterized protein BO83DRAFT_404364 [Aspergillus eucalypticola CBS 122712]PWY61767.1 hypothetical protein BO83DRAFT_404364 [Aspergillus eucalypticola CBS 122712]